MVVGDAVMRAIAMVLLVTPVTGVGEKVGQAAGIGVIGVVAAEQFGEPLGAICIGWLFGHGGVPFWNGRTILADRPPG